MIEALPGSFLELTGSGAATASDASAERGSAGAVSAAPLGKNADLAGNGVFLPAPSNIKAWWLRGYARDRLNRAGIQKRLRFCGVKVSRVASGVGVHARPDRAYGRLSGVCVCGQSICCPVCGPRIAAFRAVDVEAGFKKMMEAGYEARLLTYTLPHSDRDQLGPLLDMLKEAWKRNVDSYGKELRAGKIGDITGQEINWGRVNGWHPHKHQLRFDEKGKFDPDRHRAAWLASLEAIGRRSTGTEIRAFNVAAVGSSAGAKYVSKLALSVSAEARAGGIGIELAGGANKGRSLIALLASAAAGDEEAAEVWLAGVSVIIARKITSLKWSRGFRDICGVALEKSDEEIAAEEVVESDIYLGELNFHQWRVIVNHHAELALCLAANQGREAVNSMLMGLGAGMLDMGSDAAVETTPMLDQAITRQIIQSVDTLSIPSRADLICAEMQREYDRPSGSLRQHLEAFKL